MKEVVLARADLGSVTLMKRQNKEGGSQTNVEDRQAK